MTTTGHEVLQRLHEWATEHGCKLSSLKVASHPSYGGYGLFNTTSNPANGDENRRVALFIPNHLIISIDTVQLAAEEREELSEVLNALPPLPSPSHILTIFILYLFHLRNANEDNLFSPYVDCLPQQSLLPIVWNEQELQLLKDSNTSISAPVTAKVEWMKSTFDVLQQVNGWFQQIPWSLYLLAECCVTSRTLENPATNTPMLVPILDMANHSYSRNAAWEFTDEGIQLLREPVDISADEEITISYDLNKGTGEMLFNYGFIENISPDIISNGVVLFGLDRPPVPGGNVFRLTLESLNDSFRHLSFLTYANWLTIIPITSEECNSTAESVVHKICPSTDDNSDIRLSLSSPGRETKYFEIPDLTSLLTALNYSDGFRHARMHALKTLRNLVEHYKTCIFRPSEQNTCRVKEGSEVREEVWEIIKRYTTQEANFLDAAWEILNSEISKYEHKASYDKNKS